MPFHKIFPEKPISEKPISEKQVQIFEVLDSDEEDSQVKTPSNTPNNLGQKKISFESGGLRQKKLKPTPQGNGQHEGNGNFLDRFFTYIRPK